MSLRDRRPIFLLFTVFKGEDQLLLLFTVFNAFVLGQTHRLDSLRAVV